MTFKIEDSLLNPNNLGIKVWTNMSFLLILIFCEIKCIIALVNIICCLFSVDFVKTI